MAVVGRLIAKCYLKGESFIYVFYDNVTLDILRFEMKGNIKCKLSLVVEEPDLNEKISVLGKVEQGKDIQVVETTKQWKMIEVIEDEKKRMKLPVHMKLLASWEVL